MNKILSSILVTTALNIFNIQANPTEMLFKGIQESNMVMVLDAINDGADINAQQESGYQNTALMEALQTLHYRITNTHDTKRVIFCGSLLAGIVAGSYGHDKTEKYTAQNRLNRYSKQALNCAGGIGSFAGTTYICNRILNKIFTNSSHIRIAHAYLIVEILLGQPEINVTAVNPITSQTAHQMVGKFITQTNSQVPHTHTCAWHVVNTSDSFLKKLLTISIVTSLDIAVQAFDHSILKEKIDAVFVPIAQEIANKF